MVGCKVDPDQVALRYYYHAGAVAASRSTADGLTVGWQGGGVIENVPAGGPLPRVDTIYALQLNPEHGDATNDLVVRIAHGTPSSNPRWPVLPVGGVELGSYLMPAGATATGQATAYSTGRKSVLIDSAAGVLFQKVDPNNGSYGTTGGVWIQGEIEVPTKRLLVYTADMKIRVVAGTSGADPEELQMVMRPVLDDEAFAESFSDPITSLSANFYSPSFTWRREVDPGRHTVGLYYGRAWGQAIPHGVYDGGLRQGTALTITDGGVVA
ncbi:hypothetical protein [Litorihabitans aurantiacus]|uniref:Uncharacterized protein n=1 Tax=Litorihabitans aurantiacus TaxID=1930061 RepID=A0AA37XEC3_9MICO|nr:hypothetical protein [Litorihabitans aurantiacus]GMA31609.1 hypothetical protein GCM10025875_16010 [Litorihabitans aurantiacus]